MATTYNVYRDGKKVKSGLSTKTFSDTGLTAETAYEYHVTAENEYGESGNSNVVTVTTDAPHEPPEEPAGLSSTGNTDTEVDLEWS